MFFGYPKKGDFIGIVGNFASRALTRSIYDSFQKVRCDLMGKYSVPEGNVRNGPEIFKIGLQG